MSTNRPEEECQVGNERVSPRVGQDVDFYPKADSPLAMLGVELMPAKIVRVWPDGRVNVVIFGPSGKVVSIRPTELRLVGWGEAKPNVGPFVTWPGNFVEPPSGPVDHPEA